MMATRLDAWNARLKLFRAVVASTLLYGAGTWGLNQREIVEKVQNRFYKSLLQSLTTRQDI